MKNDQKSHRVKFTRKLIDGLELPSGVGRITLHDSESRGLMLRASSGGVKTFFFRRKAQGTEHCLLIGRYPEVCITEARRRAMELNISLSSQTGSLIVDGSTNLGRVFDRYIEGHAQPRSMHWRKTQGNLRRSFAVWAERPLSTITRAEAQDLLNDIESNVGRYTANRALADARAAINWAIANGIIPDYNPFRAIPKFQVQPRDRYLTPEEIPRVFDALKRMSNQTVKDYIFLSLFTGARRSNILAMRWEDVDLNLAHWRIPKTKNGDSQVIPLTSYAMAVLIERHRYVNGEWVFPGTGASGHLVEPIKAWRRLMKDCSIKDVRLHDLRRSLGSYMAMNNSSLHIIGQALGHKSGSATQIYAKLAHAPVREAMEQAQDWICRLAGLQDEGEGGDGENES